MGSRPVSMIYRGKISSFCQSDVIEYTPTEDIPVYPGSTFDLIWQLYEAGTK
jgi:hypothetical protein